MFRDTFLFEKRRQSNKTQTTPASPEPTYRPLPAETTLPPTLTTEPLITHEALEAGATAHAVLKDGIMSGLVAVMQELEERAAGVRQSQEDLLHDIHHIRAELRRYTESTKSPDIKSYIDKLEKANNQLGDVNRLLSSIQDRLDHMLTSISQHQSGQPVDSVSMEKN
jgi:seryl-tRNA synthetase